MNPPKIESVAGGWSVRLRFGEGQRGRFVLALASESAAQQRAEQLSKLAARLARAGLHAEAPIILRKGAEQTTAAGYASVEAYAGELCAKAGSPAPARGMTFRELGEMWTSGELARRFPDHVKVKRERSVEDDRLRLARLCETIGDVPLAVFRLEDAERAMAALPGGRRPATRRHYGQLIARLLRLAVYPMRLIPSSPIPDGFLPKLGLRPAFPFLYPSEDAQLLACADVPLAMRLLYGFLTREGCRLSEALALRWRDLDLERGVVTLGRTKTDNGRSWALSPGVAEALASCRGGAGDEVAVFPPINVDRAAELFRADLLVAGVRRAELHERTEARRPIRVHDCRATFITLALANGRTEAWVQDRSGHTTSAMLNRYRRAARFAAEVGLGPLKPLNEVLGVGQKMGHDEANGEGMNTEKAESTQSVDVDSAAVARVGLELRHSAAGERKTRAFRGSDDPRSNANEHGGPPSLGQAESVSAASEPDAVELALAVALRGATEAGRWEVVSQLAAELRARREARQAPEVVSIAAARAKRNGGQS